MEVVSSKKIRYLLCFEIQSLSKESKNIVPL